MWSLDLHDLFFFEWEYTYQQQIGAVGKMEGKETSISTDQDAMKEKHIRMNSNQAVKT